MLKNTLLSLTLIFSLLAAIPQPAFSVHPYKKKTKKHIPSVFKNRQEAKAWVLKLKNAALEDSEIDYLKSMKVEHPRLLIGKKDIVRIQKLVESDEDAGKILSKLRRKADQYLKEPTVQFIPSEDGNFLEVSRIALKRISTLAGLYLIVDDKRYLERARVEMKAIAGLKDWNPAHFLDVAEMTCAMAIGYDWLYDELSKEEKREFKNAIVNSGIKAGLKQYEIHKWWTYTPFNWNLVCNGGLIVGALAVADEEPVLANRIINCARMSVPYAMASFRPDGGWPEGPSYWCYCTRYAMFMLASLDSALGHDFGWHESPGFSDTGNFRIHCRGPFGQYFNFADSKPGPRKAPQMFWMASKFNRPVYAYSEMETARNLTDIFHLLYLPEKVGEAHPDRVALFKGINAGFYRSMWEDRDALFLGFKGGSNKVGHAHLDLGTFVLDWFGKRWAMELGPDNYSMPGYFGAGRWSYFRLNTQGQNTLLLDGKNQNVNGYAPVVEFKQAGDFVGTIDLSSAYEKQVHSATRSFRVLEKGGKNSIVISDELVLKEPLSVAWNMYTRADVEISDDHRQATLTYPDIKRKVLLFIDKPEFGGFSCSEVKLVKPQRTISGVNRLKVTIAGAGTKVHSQVRFEAE